MDGPRKLGGTKPASEQGIEQASGQATVELVVWLLLVLAMSEFIWRQFQAAEEVQRQWSYPVKRSSSSID